jgi:hypothetical protein
MRVAKREAASVPGLRRGGRQLHPRGGGLEIYRAIAQTPAWQRTFAKRNQFAFLILTFSLWRTRIGARAFI